MASKRFLNLKGVVSPLDLLKCKSSLNSMEKGTVLEVLLEDADVARDLKTIIARSNDRLIYQKQVSNAICLGIKKGGAKK